MIFIVFYYSVSFELQVKKKKLLLFYLSNFMLSLSNDKTITFFSFQIMLVTDSYIKTIQV